MEILEKIFLRIKNSIYLLSNWYEKDGYLIYFICSHFSRFEIKSFAWHLLISDHMILLLKTLWSYLPLNKSKLTFMLYKKIAISGCKKILLYQNLYNLLWWSRQLKYC
jgi:hypothetical protein